jgi:hypothetical protein
MKGSSMTTDLKRHLEFFLVALPDFLSNEADFDKFDAFDWLMKKVSAKWDAYAIDRRIDASRKSKVRP